MAMGVAIVILSLAMLVAFQLGKGKSKKRKYIVWGIATMVAIAPFLSWLIGITYGISVGSGFAAMGIMVMMFAFLFLIGLISLLIGIFRKETTEVY